MYKINKDKYRCYAGSCGKKEFEVHHMMSLRINCTLILIFYIIVRRMKI